MPIPLLNFPSDLLRDLFKECDPFDLYKLSKCSKRTRKSIMMNASTSNWKIKDNDKKIDVLCGNSQYRFIKTTIPTAYYEVVKNPLYNNFLSERKKGMFIEYPNGGFTELFVYLLDTFRIKTVEKMRIEAVFSIVSYYSLELVQTVIDRNMNVEVFHLGPLRDEREAVNFMELTKQLNVTEYFSCSQPFPEGFQHHFTRFPQMINIWDSHWFSLNQLITCSCTHVELNQSTLKNQDIDLLLQKWMKNEALPSLQFLRIWTETVDNQSPILGMIPPIEQNGFPKNEIYVKNGNNEDSIWNAAQVTKDDGTVGWLKVDLGLRTLIKLLVANSSSTVREGWDEAVAEN